ncbi:ESCRT-II subunit protein VPS25 [Saccharomyces paradoxus]|uniref:ESCRT-II subunit protein VPS25 n=1 Tax=Saccharomyces paradoxus TaxID=27291 RepID=A0A8B8UUH4_SACPA|nr:Vps25 [Saccharomyces paradoxus]QHS74329.1 Vps25 [Saccharomyces paradoxus]
MTALPPVYSFPPLYTRQPNSLTRRQQISTWIDIISQYCKCKKIWYMSADGAVVNDNSLDSGNTDNDDSKKVSKNLFNNEDIQRSVSQVFIDEIWSQMAKEGKCLPIDQSGRKSNNTTTTRYFILWKSLDNWASLILQWFEDSGKLNQVITLYELSEGDETFSWEFHGMPENLLYYCLKPLCDRNRASMLKDENDKVIAIKVV